MGFNATFRYIFYFTICYQESLPMCWLCCLFPSTSAAIVNTPHRQALSHETFSYHGPAGLVPPLTVLLTLHWARILAPHSLAAPRNHRLLSHMSACQVGRPTPRHLCCLPPTTLAGLSLQSAIWHISPARRCITLYTGCTQQNTSAK